MKLGAQLFSLRDFIKTPEDIRTTFQKIKAMGFENVQFSVVREMISEAEKKNKGVTHRIFRAIEKLGIDGFSDYGE